MVSLKRCPMCGMYMIPEAASTTDVIWRCVCGYVEDKWNITYSNKTTYTGDGAVINVCNKDCTKCKFLNTKTDNEGYSWGYDCMKYEDSVLKKDFTNTKFFAISEGIKGGVNDRTIDRRIL